MTTAKTAESALIRKAKLGDAEALSEIVHTYSDRLFTLLMRLLRNKQEAEDALQETFITMIEKLQTFREKSQLYTWLFRIATNIALMRLRKTQQSARLPINENVIHDQVHSGNILPFPSRPDRDLHNKEVREILDKAIDTLPAAYRSVFVIRDIEQLSVKETARILQLSEDNVKTRLRRARIFLRNYLAEHLS